MRQKQDFFDATKKIQYFGINWTRVVVWTRRLGEKYPPKDC
jgi:hypothetical protein